VLGVILYSLGQQSLAGTLGQAAELLQVLPSQGAREGLRLPRLTSNAPTEAIEWWVDRLNDLFAVLSDPVVFTDQSESYVPAKHLHALLNSYFAECIQFRLPIAIPMPEGFFCLQL